MLRQPHRLEAEPLGLVDDLEEERRVEPAEGDAEVQGAHVPSGKRRQPPDAHVPPSTCRVVPVTKRDRAPARYTAAPATSSTCPDSPSGAVVVTDAPSRGPTPGVGIRSGAMQLTLIRRSPSSRARLRVRFSTAAFWAA